VFFLLMVISLKNRKIGRIVMLKTVDNNLRLSKRLTEIRLTGSNQLNGCLMLL
jgi:hypothetical protein